MEIVHEQIRFLEVESSRNQTITKVRDYQFRDHQLAPVAIYQFRSASYTCTSIKLDNSLTY